MNDGIAISTHHLSKRYAAHLPYALYNLNLSIKTAEVYGFLGPNGAGKSTAIRTLLNFIQPTSGHATIQGKDIVKDSVKICQSLGYLSGDFSSYTKMSGNQFLDFMASLQPPKRLVYRKELAKRFNIDLRKRIGDLSKGNRQKIGIIQAFMHEPEIIILDEPTDGLDPLMQETFYDLVNEVQAKNTTVFVSSHNLNEVKKMCDRVGIIKDGKLVTERTIADLADEAAQTFTVEFAKPVASTLLKTIKGVKKVTKDGDRYTLHVQGDLSPLLQFLAKHKVIHLVTQELNLEDEFMKYYESSRS